MHTVKYYSTLKNKEILQNVTMWIDLEDIILREISQSQRQTLHDFTYMNYLKKIKS